MGLDKCAAENRVRQQELREKYAFRQTQETKKINRKQYHEHVSSCGCNHHEHECHHEHSDGCCCGHDHDNSKKTNIILLLRSVLCVVFLVVSFFVGNILNIVFLSISYLIIAYDVLFNAFKNLIKGKLFDENFLMSIASLTALIVYFINNEAGIDGFDGVLVILLYQIGEYFQHLAAGKSRKSITDMLDIDVEKVIKLVDNKQVEINANDISIDDVLLVKPGEKIPTDGIVVFGSSSINTSSLTGESKPIDVSINDKVLSGCINNEGVINIKAITTVENSTSAKVKKLINEANKNKAKGERFITRFAKVYTPIVILISLLVMFVIPAFLGFEKHFMTYLYKGLSIMVISCPCALVISIPLSYFMGIGKAARNGILVKGALYLENLEKIETIAFDKTGTLTKGNFEVSLIVSENKELMNDLLYSFEKNFTHPIALSIVEHLKEKATDLNVDNINNIPGKGMSGLYNEKEVLIGNEKLMNDNDIEIDIVKEIGTIIYVAYDNEFLGFVVIEDSLKDDCKKAINKIINDKNVCIISGDNKEVVGKIANELSIERYYYQALPEDKVKIVKSLQNQSIVAYVGDGINDAACLLNADVGIAMKSIGSDLAINASDIVIMDDKVNSINKAFTISKKTMNIVKMNIICSIAIKVIVMILAMFIKLPMFVAIIADVGVCLLAILNSLRIMYGKYLK